MNKLFVQAIDAEGRVLGEFVTYSADRAQRKAEIWATSAFVSRVRVLGGGDRAPSKSSRTGTPIQWLAYSFNRPACAQAQSDFQRLLG